MAPDLGMVADGLPPDAALFLARNARAVGVAAVEREMTTKCARCGKADEYVPTTQAIRFDVRTQYVCGSCWQQFRAWWFAPERASVVLR